MTARRLLICAVLALAPMQGRADDWTGEDKALLGAALGTLVIDWAQTRDLAIRGCYPRCYETNPMLGRSPGAGRVDKYFAIAMIATAGAAIVLSRDKRRFLLGSIVVVESVVVLSNSGIGLRMSFK